MGGWWLQVVGGWCGGSKASMHAGGGSYLHRGATAVTIWRITTSRHAAAIYPANQKESQSQLLASARVDINTCDSRGGFFRTGSAAVIQRLRNIRSAALHRTGFTTRGASLARSLGWLGWSVGWSDRRCAVRHSLAAGESSRARRARGGGLLGRSRGVYAPKNVVGRADGCVRPSCVRRGATVTDHSPETD